VDGSRFYSNVREEEFMGTLVVRSEFRDTLKYAASTGSRRERQAQQSVYQAESAP
jgi:hypothetical protein